MKKYSYALLSITFVLSSCSFLINKSIKGDKNIITKEFSIGDYHAINLYGSANIIYDQKSDASPYLAVEIDNNLLEYIEVKVEGSNLNIKQREGSSINPSKYVIRTNSKELKEATVYGSGEITIPNRIKSDKLALTIKGSGDIKVPNFEAHDFGAYIFGSGNITTNGQSTSAEFKVAGSGDISAKDIIANSITAQVDGSGDITLKGKSETVEYRVNGSGKVNGKTLATESANCSIAGSGSIIVNAEVKLENTITSSGSIRYVGNPQVNNSIKGSGSVKAI